MVLRVFLCTTSWLLPPRTSVSMLCWVRLMLLYMSSEESVRASSSHGLAHGTESLPGQPFIAKLADTTSRPMAYLFSLLCYIIGFLVVATARNVYSVAGGITVSFHTYSHSC
jgi:hypothetical protein